MKGIGMTSHRDHLAIGLLSTGVLLYELVLMRVFSVLMWYHFASLAIGLALLGLGAGGLAVGLWPSLGTPERRTRLTLWFSCGVVGVLAALVALHSLPDFARATLAPFHQPFYKPFERPETTSLDLDLAFRLLGLSVTVGWPFFFAGAVTTGILRERAPKLQLVYAATLLGSALGCAIFPLLLSNVSAPAVLGAAAAFGCIAAVLLAASPGQRWLSALFLAAFVCFAGWTEYTHMAEIPFARGRYEPDLLAVRWNAMSRVAAYSLSADDVLRPYGQSLKYKGEQPRQVGLVVDDSGYTNIYEGSRSLSNPEYFRANLVSAPFHLRPKARALLFGPGGGKDVWIALSFPEVTVQAVEINPLVVEMTEDVFGAFSGKPYSQPRVSLAIADARRFARQDKGSYDVIGASAVFGRLPPSAGAFTLSEDLLHTADAFEDYWERMSPDGILSITRFAYEQRALRLTSLARELLDRKGVAEPGKHIRVVSDRGLVNVMVCKRPFDPADDANLQAMLDRYGFELMYPPPEGGTNQLTRLIDDNDFKAALSAIPFDVSPPTDDRPFFYYTVRPSDFFFGSPPGRVGFDDRGAEVLRTSFLVLLGLSVLALVLPPLLRSGVSGASLLQNRGALLYFFSIGFGYMILEISTMKRLLLMLGHPIYAVTATLLAFLVGSGAGSAFSARLAPDRRFTGFWLIAVAALGVVQAFIVPPLLAPVMQYALPLRVLAAIAVTLPLAFAMGIPFPGGIAALEGASGELLPWIWAVNGFASVTASLGTILIAMNFGYTVATLLGVVCYGCAFFALKTFSRIAQQRGA